MSEDDGALIAQAKDKRQRAERARRLAAGAPDDVVSSLKAYAAELENDAFALEQQAAEMRRTVERSMRLSQDIRSLTSEARARVSELNAKLRKQ